MHIAGLEKTSLLEYPGQICAILFVQGCDYRCPYCHNPQLVSSASGAAGRERPDEIPQGEIEAFLKKREAVLDAVTVTGGEPCLYADLPEYLSWLQGLGLKVKLDTNGSRPEMLAEVLDASLVDYVALDIKSSAARYHEAVGRDVDIEAVLRSIGLLLGAQIPCEFRSTILPRLHDEATVLEMARMISGARRYFLQPFRPQRTLDPSFAHEPAFSRPEMEALASVARQHVSACQVR